MINVGERFSLCNIYAQDTNIQPSENWEMKQIFSCCLLMMQKTFAPKSIYLSSNIVRFFQQVTAEVLTFYFQNMDTREKLDLSAFEKL